MVGNRSTDLFPDKSWSSLGITLKQVSREPTAVSSSKVKGRCVRGVGGNSHSGPWHSMGFFLKYQESHKNLQCFNNNMPVHIPHAVFLLYSPFGWFLCDAIYKIWKQEYKIRQSLRAQSPNKFFMFLQVHEFHLLSTKQHFLSEICWKYYQDNGHFHHSYSAYSPHPKKNIFFCRISIIACHTFHIECLIQHQKYWNIAYVYCISNTLP